MDNLVSFDAFRKQWLEDIRAGNTSPAEQGHRFAHKLFTQWRDLSDFPEDLIYRDSFHDKGIDLAYLERGEADNENVGGDTWYLVQSKYGASLTDTNNLLQAGKGVI